MDGYAVVAGPGGRAASGRRVARRPPGRRRRWRPGTAIAHLHRRARCPRAPTPWCRSSAPRPTDGAVRRAGHRAGREHPPRRRGRARRRASCSAPAPARRRRSSGWPPRSAAPTLRCARRPRVALLVTGDELAEPGRAARRRAASTARTRYALAAQVERAGRELVDARARAPTPRRPPAPRSPRALDAADVVCVSGGVSVGPHDHVKAALAELGVEERFWGVSLRPGKPTWFGARGDTLVFGLPGNPVSAMVTFQLFVRPALRGAAGRRPRDHAARRRALDEPVARNRAARAGGARAPDAPATTAGTPRPTGRAGLARAHLDAGRDGARADPRRRGRGAPPASGWRSSCCEAARPTPAARAPPARAGARAARARSRARTTRPDGSIGSEAGGRGDAAPRGARPDLVGRVPRAPRAHLLALPDARLARPAARALHRRLARGGAAHAARSCCCASARPSTRSRPTAAPSPGRSTAACWWRRAGRGRGYLRLSRAARPRPTTAAREVTATVSSEVVNFYPLIAGWGWFARIGRFIYNQTQLRIHVIVTQRVPALAGEPRPGAVASGPAARLSPAARRRSRAASPGRGER